MTAISSGLGEKETHNNMSWEMTLAQDPKQKENSYPLLDPSNQILDTRTRLSDPGYQDPVYQIPAVRS